MAGDSAASAKGADASVAAAVASVAAPKILRRVIFVPAVWIMCISQCMLASHTCRRSQIAWRSAVGGRPRTSLAAVVRQTVKAALHLLDDLVDREARRPLARRIVLEGGQELGDQRLHREHDRPGVPHHPVVIAVRGDVGPLIGIGPKVEYLGQAQSRERLGPDAQCAGGALLLEHDLPILVAHIDEIAVVVEIDELLARAVRLLSGEVGKLVIAVEVDLEGLAAGLRSEE